jgi:hypothetical protein
MELSCFHNQLTKIPDTLPVGLMELCCYNNCLTRLPDTLPAGLINLSCSHNQLTTLPDTLPASLVSLYTRGNHLPDRPEDESIPDYLARAKAIAEAASKERIVQRCGRIFEELAQKVWHPSRVERLMLAGVDMEEM